MGNQAEKLGRQFFEDVLEQGNWDVGEQIMASDVIMHHPSSPTAIVGFEAVKGMLLAFRSGFPNLTMTVDDSFGFDDKGVVRWTMQGTHTADLFGIPPTGKSVTVHGISIVRESDGVIAEDWVSEDTMGLMQQLGVVQM